MSILFLQKLGQITQAVGCNADRIPPSLCSDVGTSSPIYFPPYITFLSPFSLPRAMVSVRKKGGAAVVKKEEERKGKKGGIARKSVQGD